MKFNLVQSVILALVLSFSSINAQTSEATVKQINSYAAEVDRFVKGNKQRIFADIAEASATKSLWKEFKTEADRQEAETGYNLNQNAYVWTREGRVIGANFTFTSPSGDWTHFIMYYFRDDGSLAKIDAQLNTFFGNISVIRHRYYDPRGRLLSSSGKYLDLETQKPKKRPVDFTDEPIPLFKSVSNLPFRKLL